MEGEVGRHPGPRAPLFSSAVVVQKWEMAIRQGERRLATKAASRRIPDHWHPK